MTKEIVGGNFKTGKKNYLNKIKMKLLSLLLLNSLIDQAIHALNVIGWINVLVAYFLQQMNISKIFSKNFI